MINNDDVIKLIEKRRKVNDEKLNNGHYRIGIDVDMTLAKLNQKWLSYYNAIFDDNLTVDDIKDWEITKYVKPEAKPYMLNILNIHKFYRDLEIMEDSQRVLKHLMDLGNELFIVTDPFTRMSYKSKEDWILESYPFIPKRNIIFTGNKSSVGLHFLIDDGSHNLETFQGVPILFDAPHNKNVMGFFRAKNWQDIEHIFDYRLDDVIQYYDKSVAL